jgi:excisionase family DNA binding protein
MNFSIATCLQLILALVIVRMFVAEIPKGAEMKKSNITPNTPTELARQRGVGLDWIYKQIRVGKIPAIKEGRVWRVIPQAAKPVPAEK